MTPPTTSRRVIYHGRVQGVGFRATTQLIARGFQVSGFVRNLADGTVELVAQGEAEKVRRFLDQIVNQFGANITASEETATTESVTIQGFMIR